MEIEAAWNFSRSSLSWFLHGVHPASLGRHAQNSCPSPKGSFSSGADRAPLSPAFRDNMVLRADEYAKLYVRPKPILDQGSVLIDYVPNLRHLVSVSSSINWSSSVDPVRAAVDSVSPPMACAILSK
jgi:hypothetical protein